MLAEHPEFAVQAVHEVMRYSPVILNTMRVPVTDVELVGVRIPAGTLVITNTAAANRDPDVYRDPDRFDITREDAPAMLTFGGGAHYCLGAHLARIELAEALTTMARRMPNIRTTGPVPWKSMTRHHRTGEPACRVHSLPLIRSRYDRPSGSYVNRYTGSAHSRVNKLNFSALCGRSRPGGRGPFGPTCASRPTPLPLKRFHPQR